MSDARLLPCPFCGGEAETGNPNQHDKLFVVGCNTPMCYGNINHFTLIFTDKESAITTWNTRKPIDRIVEEMEEEREISYADFEDYVAEKSPCLDAEYDDLFHRGLERAIKIVKAGGLE